MREYRHILLLVFVMAGVALIVLQMVTSGLNLIGVRSFATVALWGVMLIGVIAYRYVQHRRWERSGKRQRSATSPSVDPRQEES